MYANVNCDMQHATTSYNLNATVNCDRVSALQMQLNIHLQCARSCNVAFDSIFSGGLSLMQFKALYMSITNVTTF